MKYFLDSADIEQIEEYLPYIEGSTSNPKLLSLAGFSQDEYLEKMSQYNIKRFIQISQIEDVENVVRKFKPYLSHIVFKVSMSYPQGYNLISLIKDKDPYLKVAATTMYDIVQINSAIELDCDYSMVYIAKNDNEDFLDEVASLDRKSTKLVGASFRTKNDVVRAIKAGLDYSTVPPSVLALAFKNQNVDRDLEELVSYS